MMRPQVTQQAKPGQAQPGQAQPGQAAAKVQAQTPITRAEFDAFQRKRELLNAQLRSLTERRTELFGQRQQMSADLGRGHDQRIAAIDQRSAQIEGEMLDIDAAIATAISENPDGFSVRLTQSLQPDESSLIRQIRNQTSDAAGEGAAMSIFSIFGVYLVYQGIRRFIWKRKPTPIMDQAANIQRLQQSVDVIALEVERISEAQRYLAKVLNDKMQIGAGDARVKEGVPLGR